MNLIQAIEIFLEQTSAWAAKNTVASYQARLDAFAEFAKDKPLGTPTILEYKAYLSGQQVKQSTIAGHFMTLKLFFGWAVKMELLDKDPIPERMGFVVARPERQPITLEERDKLLAQVETCARHQKSLPPITKSGKKRRKKLIQPFDFWTDAINTAWHTGLRLCDVALLKKVSLDVPESSIKLIPKKTKRFAKIVHIPVPVELINRLANRSQGEYVFPEMVRIYEAHGHRLLSMQFIRISTRAGVNKSLHCFRHGAISRWLDEGVSPTMVADLTGLNLNRVMSYCHTDLETKRGALGLTKGAA